MQARKNIDKLKFWSAAMAPKQLEVARFKQFSFKPVLKCKQEVKLI